MPKLSYTPNRGIGWHVNDRDPATGRPTRKRFHRVAKTEVPRQHDRWLSEHLADETPEAPRGQETTLSRNTHSSPDSKYSDTAGPSTEHGSANTAAAGISPHGASALFE
jgi:hypothetical protein